MMAQVIEVGILEIGRPKGADNLDVALLLQGGGGDPKISQYCCTLYIILM